MRYWSLELIFKSKLKLESKNQKSQYGHQAAIFIATLLQNVCNPQPCRQQLYPPLSIHQAREYPVIWKYEVPWSQEIDFLLPSFKSANMFTPTKETESETVKDNILWSE